MAPPLLLRPSSLPLLRRLFHAPRLPLSSPSTLFSSLLPRHHPSSSALPPLTRCFSNQRYSAAAALLFLPLRPSLPWLTRSASTASRSSHRPLTETELDRGCVASSDSNEEYAVEWEEEDEQVEPQIGDGGDGGGILLRGLEWGERALALAQDVLNEHFSNDVSLFAFKLSPRGYVYVRLDKLTSTYGCPSIEEIERFNHLYKQKLDEITEQGDIPLDLAIEVSSPGAERLLKVPDDLDRFKDMAMMVQYAEGQQTDQSHGQQGQQYKDGIFMLERTDSENRHCVWKLANVKENREEAGKGRPLSRKQREWRLQVPFQDIRKVTLYLAGGSCG